MIRARFAKYVVVGLMLSVGQAAASEHVHIHFKNCTSVPFFAYTYNGDDHEQSVSYDAAELHQGDNERTLKCLGKGHHRCFVKVYDHHGKERSDRYFDDWVADKRHVLIEGDGRYSVTVYDQDVFCE